MSGAVLGVLRLLFAGALLTFILALLFSLRRDTK
jgi:hypothetical protein